MTDVVCNADVAELDVSTIDPKCAVFSDHRRVKHYQRARLEDSALGTFVIRPGGARA